MNVLCFLYCIFLCRLYGFLKRNNPPSIFATLQYHIQGYQDVHLKLDRQQYKAWSDCMDVQAGMALYWWQMLITFGSSRIRVKYRKAKGSYKTTPMVEQQKFISPTVLPFFILCVCPVQVVLYPARFGSELYALFCEIKHY